MDINGNITIARATLKDVARLNEIANHSLLFPKVCFGLPYPLDLEPVIRCEWNVVFIGHYGFIVFAQIGDGDYDVHAAVLPEGRGAWVKATGLEALRIMREQFGARLFVFCCPVGNLAASAGARMLGARLYKRIADRNEFVLA